MRDSRHNRSALLPHVPAPITVGERLRVIALIVVGFVLLAMGLGWLISIMRADELQRFEADRAACAADAGCRQWVSQCAQLSSRNGYGVQGCLATWHSLPRKP